MNPRYFFWTAIILMAGAWLDYAVGGPSDAAGLAFVVAQLALLLWIVLLYRASRNGLLDRNDW